MKELFASWSYINCLPLIIGMIVLIVWRARKNGVAMRLLAGITGAKLFTGYHPIKRIIKQICFCVALLFLFIALLRPQFNEKEIEVKQEGRELFIALDVSRSMLATDCVPKRLECAKEKITQLLNTLSCERVGLILFSGSAFVQCPLTADYDAFNMFLSHVDAETISSGTTALDKALTTAMKSFEHVSESTSKIVVLFTDGEDFSHNLSSIKQKAAKQGVSLFAVGVGTQAGAPVPVFDNYGKQIGHQKDKKGKIVISRLNEQMLSSLTHDLGGVYVRMSQNNQDVIQLVNWIESFEKSEFNDAHVIHKEDAYPYFIAAGLCCLFLEWIL